MDIKRVAKAQTLPTDKLHESVLRYLNQNITTGAVLRDADTNEIVAVDFTGSENNAEGRRIRRKFIQKIINGSAGSNLVVQFFAEDIATTTQDAREKARGELVGALADEFQALSNTFAFAPRPGHLPPSSIPGAQALVNTSPQDQFWFEGSVGDLNRIPTLRIITDSPTGDVKVEESTTDFLLQDVSESRNEKFQIVDTFGRSFAFFFGKRPEIYTYSGILLNTKNFDWKRRFLDLYENKLRGTRAVENGVRAQIAYENVVREGYILGASISYSQAYLYYVVFNFTMFITRAVSMAETVTSETRQDRDVSQIDSARPVTGDFSGAPEIDPNSKQAEEIKKAAKDNSEGVKTFPVSPVAFGFS